MSPEPTPGPQFPAAEDAPGAKDAMFSADPMALFRALADAGAALFANPAAVAAANLRMSMGLLAATRAAADRTLGGDTPGPVAPAKGDNRFSDAAFSENPAYFLMQQQYLLSCQMVYELLDAAGLDKVEDAKARFGAKFVLDSLSPTNTVLGNPAAVREAIETNGMSLVRGATNMLDDMRDNGGWPSQVDASGFELGVNMAATAGSVVFRNELIELLEYAPQTPTVHAVPLLFCPAWINKYYISDLAPGKSLIEWAVQHGQRCFAISYRNPDSSMRDLSFEDYLLQGPEEAVRVIREITGAPQVNTVSICLGGTLTAIQLARNAANGDDSIKSATLLNTHTDFSNPGTLGVFTSEETIDGLEKQMDKEGYLAGDQMAHVFDALRANDLIFNYVANNWLLGKKPPAFDLLVWNKDSTRMPAKMHTRYLRSCYQNNEFARGEFEFNGQKLDPRKVTVDTYLLSAIDDHIVPWVSGYKTSQLFSGHNRYVLSNSGHIAGIVNPPNPKCRRWFLEGELPADPLEWKERAELFEGSWWEDWATWIAQQGGPRVDAPRQQGSPDHPPTEAAPGSYVLARA